MQIFTLPKYLHKKIVAKIDMLLFLTINMKKSKFNYVHIKGL